MKVAVTIHVNELERPAVAAAAGVPGLAPTVAIRGWAQEALKVSLAQATTEYLRKQTAAAKQVAASS